MELKVSPALLHKIIINERVADLAYVVHEHVQNFFIETDWSEL